MKIYLLGFFLIFNVNAFSQNTFQDCTDDQTELLKAALISANNFVKKASKESSISKRKIERLAKKLNNLKIICADQQQNCLENSNLMGFESSFIINNKINLCMNNNLIGNLAFDTCELAGTIAHEAAHAVGIRMGKKHNQGDNGDKIFTMDNKIFWACYKGTALK